VPARDCLLSLLANADGVYMSTFGTQKRKILAIDDEKANLALIERYLKTGGFSEYDIVLSENGQEALEILLTYPDLIDLIVLDLVMPGLSGIETIKKIKQHHKLKHIPVIMQIAANDSATLTEGFKLGVYYYFTKPYMPTVFNSVVRAAIDLYTRQKALTDQLSKTRILFDCVALAQFSLKTVEEANHLSVGLAQLFPDPEKVVLGIAEILINAIEHGNLKITYDEKTELNLKSTWLAEIQRRQNLPENRQKNVTVTYKKLPNEVVLNVKDQGDGFDFAQYLEFDVSRSSDNHGRGIVIAKNLSFDRLEYVGAGNEVNCVSYISTETPMDIHGKLV
jgi:CheY-like chemotaxis protein